MLNPGFTAPLLCPCPQVTVFHDLQHKRHPEYFRWFDLPFWNFFLFWSAQVSRLLLADSDATAADLRRFYRLPEPRIRVVRFGRGSRLLRRWHAAAARSRSCWPSRPCTRIRIWTACCAPSRFSAQDHPSTAWSSAACTASSPARCTSCAKARACRNRVEFPGWIPREDLHDLYARAWAFLYPSPVRRLRAAGAGSAGRRRARRPVPTSSRSPASPAMPRLQFDPRDAGAMAAALGGSRPMKACGRGSRTPDRGGRRSSPGLAPRGRHCTA